MAFYRTMLHVMADGLPVVGDQARMLGVRVPPTEPSDVFPDATGRVHPRAGGMSVAADDPSNLPRHHRPKRFRGNLMPGRGEVYELDDDAIAPPLALRPAGPPHHLVEPSTPIAVGDFQAALGATRARWRIAP